MTDDELLKEFVRAEPAEGGMLQVFVMVTGWESPYEPTSEWVLWKAAPDPGTEAGAASLARKVLRDRRYFRVCNGCGERNPRGGMHAATLCPRRSEENHQRVY
jgi:hypothetical protein